MQRSAFPRDSWALVSWH